MTHSAGFSFLNLGSFLHKEADMQVDYICEKCTKGYVVRHFEYIRDDGSADFEEAMAECECCEGDWEHCLKCLDEGVDFG